MTISKNLQNIASLLEKFSLASGISGYEKDVREILKKEIEPFSDSVRIDPMGNLIAEKKRRKAGDYDCRAYGRDRFCGKTY